MEALVEFKAALVEFRAALVEFKAKDAVALS